MAFGVGATLRHERARRNLSLKEIAGRTRISERFLDAIERENFEQLPGLLFTRNFVRQYALALELDPEPLLAQIPKVDVAEAPLPVPPARTRAPRWDPRWNSAISMFSWLLLAGGAAGAAYYHFNRPAVVKTEYSRPIERPTPGNADPARATPAQTPFVAPATPVAQQPPHAVEVVVTAREQSWVQATADGKVAFTATMQPNETRSVSADDLVKVVAGNAGGISISLNGKVLDPLGPVGQVRVVRLTAAGPQLTQKNPQQQPAPAPL